MLHKPLNALRMRKKPGLGEKLALCTKNLPRQSAEPLSTMLPITCSVVTKLPSSGAKQSIWKFVCHVESIVKSPYRWTIKQTLVMAFLAAAAVPAQSQDTDTGSAPAQASRQGIRLNGVSAFGSYSTSSALAGNQSGYNLTTGASMSVSSSWTRPRYSFYLNYSASYARDFSYSELNSLNHDFSLAFSRKVSPTWSVSGGAGAQVLNTTQFIFQPSVSSQIANVAATADELAATSFSNSNYNNTSLAPLLIGAPILDSPAIRSLFGDRSLSTAVQIAATHTGPRLSVAFSGSGSRIQSLARSGAPSALVPASNLGGAGMNLSYSLTPRTQIGVSLSSQRTVSRLEDTYITTASANVARKMSERWFADFRAGTGAFRPVRSSFQLPTGPQYTVGAGLGFKTLSHTVLLSVGRNISDTYGYGASSTVSTTAAWNWGRRGSGWKILASGGSQQIHTARSPDLNAWLITAGVSETLPGRVFMSVTYAYMQSETGLARISGNPAIHAIRVAFGWAPLMSGN